MSKPKKKIQTQDKNNADLIIKEEKKADPIIKKEKEPFQADHEIINISSDDEAIFNDNDKALGEAFRLLKGVMRQTKKKSSLDNGLKVKHEQEEDANLSAVSAEDANLSEEPAEQSILSTVPAEDANLLEEPVEESNPLLAQDGPASNTRKRHGKSFPKKHLL